MCMSSRSKTPVWGLLVLIGSTALAQTPVTFPTAKHGAGELALVQGVPVLTVRGSPAEMGEQSGVLAGKNAPGLNALLA
jgi:isopenicillin-N N-acyltransferase like protein